MFAQVRPRLAVFTHLVWSLCSTGEKAAIHEVLTEARQTYIGPLEMGEDLMRFVLGETIDVKRFDHQKGGY